MLNINIVSTISCKKNIIIGVTKKDDINGFKDILGESSISKLEKIVNDFKFKNDDSSHVKYFNDEIENLVVVGISDDIDLYKIASNVHSAIKNFIKTEDAATLIIPSLNDEQKVSVANRVSLKRWIFDKYKTEKSKFIEDLEILVSDVESSKKIYDIQKNVTEGVFLTRTLVSEPANVINPETFEKEAVKLMSYGVEVEVIPMSDLKKFGMNGVVAVGEGSDIPPRVIVLKWIKNSDEDNIVLVGKGITFDSGGLNLKPSSAIYDMKTDMAGAATVLGTIKGLALNNFNGNVIGIVGLAENLPSGHSQKPGDIIQMMNGKTVEVADTDAEGRLVLADCLTYAQRNFKIKYMIDLATLTGACVVALGSRFAGMFGNCDKLKQNLMIASKETEEPLWALPMCDYFDKAINSDVADIKNIAKSGTGAGSSTAAHFLKRFIEKDVRWSHLDIAGVAFRKEETNQSQSGASGFGVRLLSYLITKLS